MRQQNMNRDFATTADTLSEALPYMQRYAGAVVVVKFGGNAMGDDAAMAEFARDIVLMKLQAVGLRGAIELMPDELSGGMKRRVALARALALDPPLMIYDEPLTGLDPIASGVIMSLIQRLNHSLGLTSIIVSHHVHETLPICDQVIAIANGGGLRASLPAGPVTMGDVLAVLP